MEFIIQLFDFNIRFSKAFDCIPVIMLLIYLIRKQYLWFTPSHTMG